MASFGHLHALTPRALRAVAAEIGMEEICLELTCHSRGPLLSRAYGNGRVYAFHVFRRLYGAFAPLARNSSFLQEINQHSPPRALSQDHITYIGRKRVGVMRRSS